MEEKQINVHTLHVKHSSAQRETSKLVSKLNREEMKLEKLALPNQQEDAFVIKDTIFDYQQLVLELCCLRAGAPLSLPVIRIKPRILSSTLEN